MRYFFTFFFFILSSATQAQDSYDQLISKYDRLRNLEKYDSALLVAKQLNSMALQNETDTSLMYAVSLRYLGICYMFIQKSDSAIYYINISLKILEQQKRNIHPDYAKSLNNLGVLFKEMGDYKSAEKYYKQSLEIRRNTLGESHPDYIANENNYAYLLIKTFRENQAYEVLNKNFEKKIKEIAENFEWLNENQKEVYWKKVSSFYDKLSWFANEVNEKVPKAVGLNYNASLFSKSKMLEAKISSENYYRDVDVLREELAYRRRLLNKLESDGSEDKEIVDKLITEADSIDKRLTISWPEYAQQKKNLSITWDQVQQNLDNNEAAIEFVRYKNEDDSLYYYNALIIRKNDKYPVLVQLCPEKKLLNKQPQFDFDTYYKLVWQPMEAYLKDIKTIYYSPVGELNNLPFHAFKTENDEYLMDHYTLHQLTSTRYLAMGLKQKEKEPIPISITMVGGVNYDFLPNTNFEFANNSKKNKLSRSGPDAKKHEYLEGTKKEVENINTTLKSLKWSTIVFENNDATEENIMKLEGKEAKGILHISTHGYAFPEFNFNDSTIDKNSLRYSYRYSQNPMVRSGLILTGGNWAWMGSDTLTKMGAEQNGILTALEVSQLNLRKTKLVVLSACETGLGKIEGSEGTFGLKRAFKLAGVEDIIVSLWKVPDDQTMELMTLFYNDLAKTLNPVISFAKAQKDMRNKYPYKPKLWAGFVLVR